MEMYGYEFIRESDLTHHGIKGQKWGQRRFQNEDGTWTAAGKERYGSGVADAKAAYKAAKKEYNASFNNAYRHNHPYSFSKKKREETQQRWNDVYDKADKLNAAKRAVKDAKIADKNAKSAAKNERKEIRQDYKNAQRERNKELAKINDEYDKKKTENAFGLDSGNAKDRVKKHLENEYKRQQEINKWDQKNLDAKRQYRTAMGKKKTDTLLMKWQQESINDISKQTQSEFNKEYIKYVADQAFSTASKYAKNRNRD